MSEIRRIHEQSKASYGSPRMTEELRKRGFDVSRPRVARLMKESGIKAVHAKKFVVTTDSNLKPFIDKNDINSIILNTNLLTLNLKVQRLIKFH